VARGRRGPIGLKNGYLRGSPTAASPSSPAQAADQANESGSGDLDRHLVDLGGRVTGPRVDAQDGLLAGTGREAEELPGLWIEPGVLEMDPLLGFDRILGRRGVLKLALGDTTEAFVHIHEARHARSDLPVMVHRRRAAARRHLHQ
jgi:hypothetical protein